MKACEGVLLRGSLRGLRFERSFLKFARFSTRSMYSRSESCPTRFMDFCV